MASLVLGVAGALALGPAGLAWGGALGMSGASIGFTIGSTLGSMLFAPNMPDIQGPRLSDLKVQSSTYGKPIPIYYGTARGSGEVIWSTPLIETAHEEEAEGGKGGGGSSQTYTTYTYSVSCAVAICEGPISGVRRIWANGELIFDVSNGNAGFTGRSGNIRIYGGTETQMPDSLIQAHVGVGNAPAHRGMAYVVFENFQLAKYGNRTPTFSFEVVVSGFEFTTVIDLPEPPRTTLKSGHELRRRTMAHPYIDGVFLTLSNENGGSEPYVLHITNAITKTTRSITVGDLPSNLGGGGMTYVESTDEIWISTDAAYLGYSNDVATAIDATSLVVRRKITPTTYKGFQIIGDQMYYEKSSALVLFAQGGSTITAGYTYLDPIQVTWGLHRETDDPIGWYTGVGATGNLSIALSNFQNYVAIFSGGLYQGSVESTGDSPYLTYDSNRNRYAWWDRNTGNTSVFRTVDETFLTMTEHTPSSLTNGVSFTSIHYMESIDKYILSDGNQFLRLNASTFEIEYTYSIFDPAAVVSFVDNILEVKGMPEYFVGDTYEPLSGRTLELFQLTNRFNTDPKILADIVRDICRRCDLSDEDIDVTALEPYDCNGYIIGQQMSGRAAIDGLQAAFFFDAVESN